MRTGTGYEVPVRSGPVEARVEIPGSKSITNRGLLLAALSVQKVTLTNVLFSDDSRNFLTCLIRLGIPVAYNEEGRNVQIIGQAGAVPRPTASIYVGSAGTAARFLTAMLAAAGGEYLIEASPQMTARPMKPLLDSLRELGAEFRSLCNPDCLPFTVKSSGLDGGRVRLDASLSSQFLSALLMIGPLCRQDLEIRLEGHLPAQPFVAMTLRMMADFGVAADQKDFQTFRIRAGQRYQGDEYRIEPDISNANYFFAMAALTGGVVTIPGVRLDTLQGDIAFLDVLKRIGCTVKERDGGLTVRGPAAGVFPGIDADFGGMPDQTMTLAAIAPFATSPTIIRNVGVIRHHESNRLRAIVTELGRLGIATEEIDDGLVIHPGRPRPVTIETYDDHRMAMAFALVGLKVPGVLIANPECTAKTFENYFEVFEKIVRS